MWARPPPVVARAPHIVTATVGLTLSDSSTQLRFAIEFATFLVAVAGAAVVLFRPALVGARGWARLSLVLGFMCLAAAAFLHGSLLSDADDPVLVAVRGAGIVLLALG